MNDLEKLTVWYHRRCNETYEEHDMRMDSIPPLNVLAALNRVNERGDSAMLPTSHSSSNGGRGNTAKANRARILEAHAGPPAEPAGRGRPNIVSHPTTSHLPTPVSKNISSDRVCDRLPCVVYGSSCHTADYLTETGVGRLSTWPGPISTWPARLSTSSEAPHDGLPTRDASIAFAART
jgi:hypothetical protein